MNISNNMKLILILILIVIGHSLAFDDEVAQERINNQSATYVADNINQIGGNNEK